MRPRKFKSAIELDKKIEEYFNQLTRNVLARDKQGNIVTDADDNPVYEEIEKEAPTILSLCVYLTTQRETFNQYAKGTYDDKENNFSEIIALAKQRIESYAEQCLFDKTRKNPAGIIFNLKNNFDWKDKKEIETTTNNNVVMLTSKEDLISGIMKLTNKLNDSNVIDVEAKEVEEIKEYEDYEDLL
ncbi:hypothetical protein SH1V18_03360 [Vallitalea longa]|uniref:Uncharacterized protein n=1 Tax=Vallitalea longa TaxID=2936439 RepID=A0A9W6DD07_9FIRM|nr:terminase small subunit [Vallitalea longa]GKX27856.1 hypothetical protein SH1V18_03360 [Vallitalea longa]